MCVSPQKFGIDENVFDVGRRRLRVKPQADAPKFPPKIVTKDMVGAQQNSSAAAPDSPSTYKSNSGAAALDSPAGEKQLQVQPHLIRRGAPIHNFDRAKTRFPLLLVTTLTWH